MKRRAFQQNNKGFSLVELIIVMAIMAILVGAIAPQVMSYVESSRKAKDLEIVNTVFTAAQTAIAAETTTPDSFSGTVDQACSTFSKMGPILQDDYETAGSVQARCKSKDGRTGTLYVTYSATSGAISVFIGPNLNAASATIGPATN